MAQLLSSNISGTLTVSQNTTISGNLLVAGYNILNEVFQADNTTRVSANSGSTQSAVSLNFVNTATVQVSVISGGAGVANVAFTSTSGGTGTVTQVNSGLGLTGGPITSTGTLSANIASTTVQGVTKLIDVVTSADSGNAATGAAVKTTFDQATSAYSAANAAVNRTQVSANGGSIQSNVSVNFINTSSVLVSVGAGSAGNANVGFSAVAGTTSVAGILQLIDSVTSTSTTTAATPNSVKTAFDQATLGYGQANAANSIAISAYGQANLAYAAANNAANTVRVSANSGSIQSAVSLNFTNTSTIQVTVGAGAGSNANISFDFIGSGTAAFPVSGNTGSTVSATGVNFSNTATIRVNVGSGISGNANVSFDYIGATGGGGGGMNTFPVSANSGSTVTANGINFVNSASVNVSVSSGTTGNANVSFTNTGVFGNVQLQYNSTTYSLDVVFLG